MEQPGSSHDGLAQRDKPSVSGAALFALPTAGLLAQAAYAFSLYQSSGCIGIVACPRGLKFFGFAWVEFGAVAAIMIGVVVIGAIGVGCKMRTVLPHLRRVCPTAILCSTGGGGSSLWRWARRQPLQDPDAERVRREFEKQQLRFVRSVLTKAAVPLLAGMIAVALREASGYRRSKQLRVTTWELLFDRPLVHLTVTAALAVAADARPSIVTRRFLDRCNVLLSALWIWQCAVVSPAGSATWVTSMLRVFFTVVAGSLRQTALSNTLVFAGNAVCLLFRQGVPNSSFPQQVGITIAVYAVAWVWHEYQLGQARTTVQAQKLNHGAVLLERMMEVMCDAVPRLDSHLRLLEPCRRLSSLLLRDGGISQGTCFADLVVQEDLDNMLACLKGPAQQAGGAVQCGRGASFAQGTEDACASFAGLCRARLRTANSLRLPVLVYYSCVPNPDGQPEFLLGLSEDTQEGYAAPHTAAHLGGGLAALPEAQAALEDEVRSNSTWSAVSSEGEGDVEQHSLVVDLGSSNLRVLASCASFRLLGGADGICEGLVDWVGYKDVRRIQQRCGCVGGSDVTVRLTPTAGGGKYKCKVARAPDGSVAVEAEAMETATKPVCLTLRTTEFSPVRKKRAKDLVDGLMDSSRSRSKAGPLASRMVRNGADRAAKRCANIQDVVLFVKFQEGDKLQITKVSSGRPEIGEQFEGDPELHRWLEDPSGFVDAVCEALAKLAHTKAEWAGRMKVGTFAFRLPGSGDALLRWRAEVLLLSLSWSLELNAQLGLVAVPAAADHVEPHRTLIGKPLGNPPEASCNLRL